MKSNPFKNSITIYLICRKWSILFLVFTFVFLNASAQDDVYDPPKPKKVRSQNTTAPSQYDRAQSYREDQIISDDNRSSYYSDDDDLDYGYVGRIRRFHHPSVRFSYGYSFIYDPFYNSYDPYTTIGAYSFTPSWVYGYNNFYNPFWGSCQMIIVNDPWMNCWNYGYYNPYSWNYFSPYSNMLYYNNSYPYYHGHYDAGRRNVVYGPRRSNYSNTNPYRGNNSNSNTPIRQNTSPDIIKNNQAPKKWDKVDQPKRNQNTYQYNNPGNTPRPTSPPSNNWDKEKPASPANDGGIKIGKKPK